MSLLCRFSSIPISIFLFCVACGEPSSVDSTDEPSAEDTSSEMSSESDTVSDDAQDAGIAEGIPNEWGFPMRVPGESEVVCYLIPEEQVDWVCTLEYESMSGVIYFQSNPVECPQDRARPIYAVAEALISIDDNIESLSNPVYELVEHVNNSFIDFDYKGRHYRYDHSDISDYGTACHSMDCLIVSETTGGAVIENGCTEARTLPIACVQVGTDGTLPKLEDTFKGCDDYW